MKKNAMLKVAAGLMVAVLLTTCAVSSTFAKYVKGPGTPVTLSADVANWNLTLTPSGSGLFADSYASTVDSTKNIAAAVTGGSTGDIVAPGLTKTGTFSATFTGTSEVAFKIVPTATVTLTGFDTYCPIVFTVGSTNYKVADGGTEAGKASGSDVLYDSAAHLATGVANAIKTAAGAKEFAPGSYTDESVGDAVSVKWAWAFAVEDNLTDADDTTLGETGTAAISVAVAFGAEQIADFTAKS